jgi:hypothetical protein
VEKKIMLFVKQAKMDATALKMEFALVVKAAHVHHADNKISKSLTLLC